MKRNLPVYLVALACFCAGMGYLLYTGLSAGTAYHIDVADALTLPADDPKPVKVFGTVSEEYLERGPNSIGVRFVLQDHADPTVTITVVYRGAVPEGFKPGIELYADGRCDPRQKLLEASDLMTKCPSKYKKENRT